MRNLIPVSYTHLDVYKRQALRALSYASPLSKFKDDTDGIGYYEVVKDIEEHFTEKKDELIANLQKLARQIFRTDNMMVSYTSSTEGLDVVKKEIEKLVSGEITLNIGTCLLYTSRCV